MKALARHPLVLAAAVFLVAGWPASLGAAGQPTLTTIALDGSFDDWQTVFANEFNIVFDGDGSSIPCADSSDRDCIVPSATSDMSAFAFTWDDQNLYLYVERFASANNKNFNVYLDVNDDGMLDGADLVLQHAFKQSQGQIQPALSYYLMQAGTPDPIVDALSFGDGYSVPGGIGTPIANPAVPGDCFTCGSSDGLAFEFAWPWAALNMTPGQAFQHHVSATNTSGSTADDNMAGRLGKGGGNAYYLHELSEGMILSGAPQTSVLFPHVLTIQGNKPDRVNFQINSALGLEVCIYLDTDQDGSPEAAMGCDRKGDGDFTDGADFVTPASDSDGDTYPDTDLLSPGDTFGVVVEVFLDNNSNHKSEVTTLQTRSTDEPALYTKVLDRVAVGEIAVFPSHSKLVTPDSTVSVSHSIDNNLPSAETLNLAVNSSQSWTWELWSDPNGDGDAADGVPLFDTDGDTLPDVNIGSGGRFPFVAIGTVPISAPLGTVEGLSITASSNGNVTSTVANIIEVAEKVSLDPSYLAIDGNARAGSISYPVFYRHTLRWAGPQDEVFDLFALSDNGFQIDFFSDPNGDGNPSDGTLLPEPVSTPALEAYGGSFTFLVRVSVPLSAVPGTIDQTDVFAVARSQPDSAQATDETRVTLIQTFKDAALAVPVSHMPGCSTVYARVHGLVPSQSNRYRIRWDDPSGAGVRTTPFSSDQNGEGFDQLSLSSASPLGLWRAAVQEDQGGAWVDMDNWFFEVENPGTFDLITTDRPSYMVLDSAVTVSARFRNNGEADLGPLSVRFRILNPSGDQILDPGGNFIPFTGSEDTWTTVTGPIPAGDSEDFLWTVTDIAWVETGFQNLIAEWDNECGTTVASSSETFLLDPDFDADGVDDVLELDVGLDPLDRDTDDDGVIDGPDGTTDTDGDTVIDALDCDSDDDGLNDGLESGVDAAGADPDTDTTSICFIPDGDAGATITDPKVADTDSGGIPDGQEDSNGNGVVDIGEGDPNDPADDTCPPGTPIEVAGLRIERQAADVLLRWDIHPDICATYRVLSSTSPGNGPSYVTLTEDLAAEEWTHAGAAGEGVSLRSWLIQAVSPVSGDGELGHFGQ